MKKKKDKIRLIIGGKEISFRRNISLDVAGKIIEYIGFVYHPKKISDLKK